MVVSQKFKYVAVGGLNTVFGYLTGVLLYRLLSQIIDILLIGLVSNIICITFSFVTYKLFVFRTVGNWMSEYIKAYLVYGFISLIGVGLLWLYVDKAGLNIWIGQGLVIVTTVLLSYIGHSRVTFRNKEKKL